MRDPLVAQLTQGITPEKIALTLAFGVALGLFPAIGVTSLFCFFAAVVFRLNQPIIQLTNQALWSVHLPVVIGCAKVGEWVFNVPKADRLSWDLDKIRHDFHTDLWQTIHNYRVEFVHTLVVWAILVPPCLALVYFATLPIIRGILRAKAEAALKKATIHPVP